MKPNEKIIELVEKYYSEYDDHTTGQMQDSKEECYKCAEEMYEWTKEYMLKQLEVWEDYYLNYHRIEVAEALEEIITWFRSPEI